MKIGNVELNLDYYNEKYHYEDGIEDDLLELVKSGLSWKEMLAIKESWPFLYHLHPDRENILKWYPFSGDERVLEIGSGCGALTGLLARSCKDVVCNDISLKRSQINAYRNKDYKNINIYVSNFMDLPKDSEYDLITLIGVLEYSQSYIEGDTPYINMLKTLNGMIKSGGSLLLAIENQFGLKYWSGCVEDHLATYFTGIEGYPNNSPARTFSRRKLEIMLKETGFNEILFYYPMPDYKFAYEIFSDKRLPNKGELVDLKHNYDHNRIKTFDEQHVYNALIEERQFPFFANSFLVEAIK